MRIIFHFITITLLLHKIAAETNSLRKVNLTYSTATSTTTDSTSSTATSTTTVPTSSTATSTTTVPTSSTATSTTTGPTSSTAKSTTTGPTSSTATSTTTVPTSSTATSTTTGPTSSTAKSTTTGPTSSTATSTTTVPTSSTATSTTTGSTSSTATSTTTVPTSSTATSTTTVPTSSTATSTTTGPTSSTAKSTTTGPTSSTATSTTTVPTSSTATSTTTGPTSSTAKSTTTGPTSSTATSTTTVPTSSTATSTTTGSTSSTATSTTTVPTSSTATSTTTDPTSTTAISTTTDSTHGCPKCSCGKMRAWTRIFGGTPTYPQKYPWLAIITMGSKFCSAVLINDKYVVTASQCVNNVSPNAILVRLLEHNIYPSWNSKHIDFRVRKVIVHDKSINDRYIDNDIALLRLDTEGIRFGPSTGLYPVCLPPSGETFAAYLGIIAGWGRMKNQCLSSVLQEATIPILRNDICYSILKKNKLDYKISDKMMCAQDAKGGKNAAKGDGGGPLAVEKDGVQYLVGLLSGVYPDPKLPSIYIRVNKYLSWFEKNMPDACPCPGPNY